MSAAWVLSARVANPVPLLVLAVLVSFCVLRERTPHARQLTIISLVAGAIAVLLGLVLALFGFGATAPVLAVLAAIVLQAISIIAVGLLIKLLQLQAVPRRLPAGIGLVPHPSDELSPPSAVEQRLQPTWHPDAACRRSLADGGRRGGRAPAAGWGTDGSSVGWQPIPTQTIPVQPIPAPPMSAPPIADNPTGMAATRMSEDPIRSSAPVHEQQVGPPKDPWADQGQRAPQQQPPVDWWGRPQS